MIIPLFCGTSLSGQPVSSNYPAIPQGWPLSTGLTLDSYLLSNTISILENLSKVAKTVSSDLTLASYQEDITCTIYEKTWQERKNMMQEKTGEHR